MVLGRFMRIGYDHVPPQNQKSKRQQDTLLHAGLDERHFFGYRIRVNTRSTALQKSL